MSELLTISIVIRYPDLVVYRPPHRADPKQDIVHAQ